MVTPMFGNNPPMSPTSYQGGSGQLRGRDVSRVRLSKVLGSILNADLGTHVRAEVGLPLGSGVPDPSGVQQIGLPSLPRVTDLPAGRT